MTAKQVLQLRLHNLQISSTQFKTPQELVHWMGAMQAQDYAGAKWSVGLRLPGITDADIDDAINQGKIIRTWMQRGTLHLVAPQDVRWILDLQSERVLGLYTAMLKNTGLDTALMNKCLKIITRALEGGKGLTRNEIRDLLEQKKITTKDRLYYILVYGSLKQLLCHGPRKSKEFSFVLMDEWVPAQKKIKKDEAAAKLAERFFTSHGPATLQDFVWWIGGTVKEAQQALKNIEHKLDKDYINGIDHYFVYNGTTKANGVHLLPGFDEYMLGYKDRSLVLADEHKTKVTGAANGLFAATVVVNGGVAGTWKRLFEKKKIIIEVSPFEKLSAIRKKAIEKEAKSFSNFLHQPCELNFL